jgi:hypothetical protein
MNKEILDHLENFNNHGLAALFAWVSGSSKNWAILAGHFFPAISEVTSRTVTIHEYSKGVKTLVTYKVDIVLTEVSRKEA